MSAPAVTDVTCVTAGGALTLTGENPGTRTVEVWTTRPAPHYGVAQVLVEVVHQGPREHRVEFGRLSPAGVAGGRGTNRTWGESLQKAARRSGRAQEAGVGQVVPEPVSSPGRRTTHKETSASCSTDGSDWPPPSLRPPRRSWSASCRARRPRPSPTSTTCRRASTRSSTRPSRPRSGSTTPSSSWPSSAATWSRSRPTRTARTPLDTAREDLQDSIVSQYEGTSLSAVGLVADSDDADPSSRSCRRCRPTTTSSPSSSTPSPPSQGARHPQRGDRAARRGGPAREAARRPRSRRSTTSSPRPRTCSTGSRTRSARRCSRRGSVRLPSGVAASGRAAIAVHYAMAQVGKAYVYGAAGPTPSTAPA